MTLPHLSGPHESAECPILAILMAKLHEIVCIYSVSCKAKLCLYVSECAAPIGVSGRLLPFQRHETDTGQAETTTIVVEVCTP